MSDYISLKPGQRESITLAYDKPYESDGQYGKQYIYGCNEIITGETKFTANPRVHGLIQELGVSKGDTIIIEKVKANPNDYIKVEVPSVPAVKTNPPPTHKSIENLEKQFEPKGDKMGLHELTARVEKLETTISTLWTDYGNRTSDAGHKVGDDKLPF